MRIFTKFYISLLLALSTISCSGQEEGIPDKVIQSFQAKYPKASQISWEQDAHGYFEAQFHLGDRKYRADFEASGQWVETEESVKAKDLPESVKDTIQKEFDDEEIAEIEKVDHHSKGTFYDVEFKEKGKNKDVEISTQGKILRE